MDIIRRTPLKSEMMSTFNIMDKYTEEVGGVYSIGDIDAIPYNHWKKDCEWLVFIIDAPEHAAFVPVNALSAREACAVAILKYTTNEDLE